MNFRQLHTLLSSPRVQYLKWKDDDVYATFIELIAERNLNTANPDKELGVKASDLAEKFITQIKDKFDIDLTSEELGLA